MMSMTNCTQSYVSQPHPACAAVIIQVLPVGGEDRSSLDYCSIALFIYFFSSQTYLQIIDANGIPHTDDSELFPLHFFFQVMRFRLAGSPFPERFPHLMFLPHTWIPLNSSSFQKHGLIKAREGAGEHLESSR